MVIRPILWKKPRRDGAHNIKIYLYRSAGDKRYVTTPHYVLKNEWSDDKWVLKHRVNYESINASLRANISDLEARFLKDQSKGTRAVVKREEGRKTSLSGYLKAKIAELDNERLANPKTGKPYSPGSRRAKQVLIGRVLRFFEHEGRDYDFDDVNFKMYEKYVGFLRYEINEEEGLNENTIGKTVQIFKEMMRRALKDKLHANTEYEDFPEWRVESDNIALDEDEIERIMHRDLSAYPHLEIERDRFYVAYNFFLRFKDSISFDNRDFKKIKGIIYLDTIPGKTQNKVIVPLKPRTLAILKKYGYQFPRTSSFESNWRLKEIGRLAGIDEKVTITESRKGKFIKKQYPKYELITTHTARRSAATNLYMAMEGEGNIDLKLIAMLGGWKTVAQLETYLKLDKQLAGVKAQKHSFFNR